MVLFHTILFRGAFCEIERAQNVFTPHFKIAIPYLLTHVVLTFVSATLLKPLLWKSQAIYTHCQSTDHLSDFILLHLSDTVNLSPKGFLLLISITGHFLYLPYQLFFLLFLCRLFLLFSTLKIEVKWLNEIPPFLHLQFLGHLILPMTSVPLDGAWNLEEDRLGIKS